MGELLRIRLGDDSPLIRLLDKVLVALLIRKSNRVVLALEAQVGALHEVCGGLPAHERILPAVALFEDVPVHAPSVRVPVAGLCGGLCGFVDARRGRSVNSSGRPGRGMSAYRTVRACSSMGAPDTTAAAVLSPGSLPSMTRMGTGEKLLSHALAFQSRCALHARLLRCPVVCRNVPVGVVSGLRL